MSIAKALELSVREEFKQEGYIISKLFDDNELTALYDLICSRVNERLQAEGFDFQVRDLSTFHTLDVPEDVHKKIFGPNYRYLDVPPILVKALLGPTVREIAEAFWGHSNICLLDLVNGETAENTCGFRVIRPHSKDVSGIHSESSYGIHPITVWMPVLGFDERYTLKISPRSHAVKHPAEMIEKVPGFMARPYKDEYLKNFQFYRPNMRPGEAIVFHPDLIHGGSANLGDLTRVSIEVRIYPEGTKINELG